MRNKLNLALIALLLFVSSPSLAKGNMKGNLDSDEIAFFEHTVNPILIRSKLCDSAGDCLRHDYIFCMSHETLSCDVYGITDEKVIKEIILAVLNSGLRVSSFTFWRSKHQEKSFFERPLLNFTDHTGDK